MRERQKNDKTEKIKKNKKNKNYFFLDRKRYQEGTNKSGLKWRYFGDLVDGKREGIGRISWETGSFYSGKWKNERKNEREQEREREREKERKIQKR